MKTKMYLLLCIIFVMISAVPDCFAQEFHSETSSPEYKGGFKALKEFLQENIGQNVKEGRTGIVTLSYIISETGKVENVKVLRGIDAGRDLEAVRAAMKITDWKPAVRWGTAIPVKVIMPVEFKLDYKEAKDIPVSGIVSDKVTGKPIEQVLVIIRGTKVGALTAKDGSYSLILPDENSELEFGVMGYKTVVEKAGANRTFNVEMSNDEIVIDFKE